METIIEHLTEMESLLDTLVQGVESTCAERRQLTEVQAALTEENKALEEKNTALVSENKLLKTENEMLKQQIASLEQQVASLEQRISSLGEVVSESQAKLLAMEQRLQALTADMSASPLTPVAANIQDSCPIKALGYEFADIFTINNHFTTPCISLKIPWTFSICPHHNPRQLSGR